MKMRRLNVYHNLIKDENSLIEAFCNLLSFDSYKNVFADFVCKQIQEEHIEFKFDEIQTQFDLVVSGRPDLIIETDDLIIYMECKIKAWTKLTRNQSTSYLNALKKKDQIKKYLIFFLPDFYHYEQLLKDCVNEFGHKHPNHGIKFLIIRWSGFYYSLQKSGLNQLDTCIEHFSEFLKNWFIPIEIKFTKEELEMVHERKIPEFILKLTTFLTAIKVNLGKEYKIGEDGENIHSAAGFYIKDKNGKNLMWFGLWYDFWRDRGLPLVVAVYRDWEAPFKRVTKKYRYEFQPYSDQEEGDCSVYPLPVEYLSRSDVNEVTEWLREIINTLLKSD